eukprot:COSAG01_NODE_1800_length_9205_cov_18.778058_2_plen_190_part_00
MRPQLRALLCGNAPMTRLRREHRCQEQEGQQRRLLLFALAAVLPLLLLGAWKLGAGDLPLLWLRWRSPCTRPYDQATRMYDPVDVVIVLGFELDRGGRVGPNLASRLEVALELVTPVAAAEAAALSGSARERGQQRVLFTGGVDLPGLPSEAAAMRAYFEAALAKADTTAGRAATSIQYAVEEHAVRRL